MTGHDFKEDDARAMALFAGPTVSLNCHNLKLKSSKKQGIIRDFSFKIEGGSITQICSFNEATTYSLIHTFRGLRSFGKGRVTAEITNPSTSTSRVILDDDKAFKNIMPKMSIFFDGNDSLIGSYTVGQILKKRAKLICDNMTAEDRDFLVDWIIRRLQLESIIHTSIGDSNRKGISTGQRRRLSLALLLLHRPRVLFLNNALVGLDSITANLLVGLLRDELAAKAGCTIVLSGADVPPVNWRMFQHMVIMCSTGSLCCSNKIDVIKGLTDDDGAIFLQLWKKIQGHDETRMVLTESQRREMDQRDIRNICNMFTMVAEYLESHDGEFDHARRSFGASSSKEGMESSASTQISSPISEKGFDRFGYVDVPLEGGRMKKSVNSIVSLLNENSIAADAGKEPCNICDWTQADSSFESTVCPDCWWKSFHWSRNTFFKEILYCFKSSAQGKLFPIKSYLSVSLAYIILGAILGYVFWNIPGRITSNPAMPFVDGFYDDTMPAIKEWAGTDLGQVTLEYVHDFERLIRYGVGGSEGNPGPHPMTEMIYHGIDGSGRMPFRDTIQDKMTYMKLRCFSRCLYTTMPFNRTQYGYPSADMLTAAMPNDMQRLQAYVCPEDAEGLTLAEILRPDETLTDITALVQSLHFIATKVDFPVVFPGLDVAVNDSDKEGMAFWLPVIEKSLGLLNNVVGCLGLPAIPCIQCNHWPEEYTPCDPRFKTLGIQNCDNEVYPPGSSAQVTNLLHILQIDEDQLLNALDKLTENLTSSLGLVADEGSTVPFKWSNRYNSWLQQIFPVPLTGSRFITTLLHAKSVGDGNQSPAWEHLVSSLEVGITAVESSCQSEWCKSIGEKVKSVELTMWNIFDVLWQILNTTGCVFAINAAIPFFTMEGLISWSLEYKRFTNDSKHRVYGTISFSIAQFFSDFIFTVIPLIICATLWTGMCGFYFDTGITLRCVLIFVVMVFTTYSFCYMVGCCIERSEVSLVITAFAFIIMLLFSGFVLRAQHASFHWTQIFEALSLHRWSYFGLMLNLFPPECASDFARDPSLYSADNPFPHYGIIGHDLLLWLSGVPSDCSVTLEDCLVYLACYGIAFRIIAVLILHWKHFK